MPEIDAICRHFASGANRDRTGDLLLAKQALSHLSYGPVEPEFIGHFRPLATVREGVPRVPILALLRHCCRLNALDTAYRRCGSRVVASRGGTARRAIRAMPAGNA